MKIYNELESLRFFEWLKEKGFGSGFTPIILDAQPIDSIERSGYNAIAFRWFREKYNIQCSINFYSESLGVKKVPNHYEIQIDYLSNNRWCYFENIDNKIYLTYEEAELECLKKLIEIVKSKNQ